MRISPADVGKFRISRTYYNLLLISDQSDNWQKDRPIVLRKVSWKLTFFCFYHCLYSISQENIGVPRLFISFDYLAFAKFSFCEAFVVDVKERLPALHF